MSDDTDGYEAPDPARLGESLDRVLRCLGAPTAGALSRLHEDWDAVVGLPLASHARPESVVGGRLLVSVDEPGWATQMRYREAAVLAWLERIIGPDEVARMDVRVVGTVTPPW